LTFWNTAWKAIACLPEREVALAVTPHLGEALGYQEWRAARSALEERYHDAGFLTVLVSIPEQQVDGGMVGLLVTEASVSRLQGGRGAIPSAQCHSGAHAAGAEGAVPNFNALQQSLGRSIARQT